MKKIVFSVMLAVLAAASCAMTGQKAGSESSDNKKQTAKEPTQGIKILFGLLSFIALAINSLIGDTVLP